MTDKLKIMSDFVDTLNELHKAVKQLKEEHQVSSHIKTNKGCAACAFIRKASAHLNTMEQRYFN